MNKVHNVNRTRIIFNRSAERFRDTILNYGEVKIILILLMSLPLTCLSQQANLNKEAINRSEKFSPAEKNAEFPGGMARFYKYVTRNLKYPEVAKDNRVEGKVFIEFVIDIDGSIDDESVHALTRDELKKLASSPSMIFDHDCQVEAVRILQGCPDWKPATLKGKPVRQKMILPISFKI